ncbi:MAG: dipeptidase [Dermatophilus congolensis]|nr:dipeptidase [Dermatophilus congolensis]
MNDASENIDDLLAARVAQLMPGVVADLTSLARIPSVSVVAEHASDLQASADAVAVLLEAEGATTRVVRAGGHPAVIAHVEGTGERPEGQRRPRVLFYAHHDVQPTGDEADWDSPPFEPTLRGDRLFGRGVADDKAGVMAHVAAIRAFDGRPPVDVIVFVEGEEEAGSESLPELLSQYRDELDCDVIVLADSANWAVGTPALTTSLRGNVVAAVELRTLDHGIHSGMFGGVVPDAVSAMCRLLATLHDERGEVAIAGLDASDTTVVDYTEEQVRSDSGVLDGVELIGSGSFTSRLWTKPALTITGFDGPSTSTAPNVLTPVCKAVVSLRTAPGQDVQRAYDLLVEHLRAHTPWGARVEVDPVGLGEGFEAATSGPAVDAARSAMTEAWGMAPVDAGIGGSIPFIAQFAEAFPQAQILVTGVEDPDTRAHGANESLHLGEFERVCLAEALLLHKLAQGVAGA